MATALLHHHRGTRPLLRCDRVSHPVRKADHRAIRYRSLIQLAARRQQVLTGSSRVSAHTIASPRSAP
jgi:hypothetical protein